MKKFILLLLSALTIAAGTYYVLPTRPQPQATMLTGPILYGITADGKLFKIDVMTCTACPIANLSGIAGAFDLLVLPNGDILVQADGLLRYTLPNTNPIWTDNSAGYGGSITAPDGTIYLSRFFPTAGLSTYDPNTNNIVFIGDWPAGMIISEFFYQNGALYGFGSLNGSQIVVQINTTDPSQSTVIHSGLSIGNGGTTNEGYTTALGSSNGKRIHKYNVLTNSFELICDLTALLPGLPITGLSDLPPNVPEAPASAPPLQAR